MSDFGKGLRRLGRTDYVAIMEKTTTPLSASKSVSCDARDKRRKPKAKRGQQLIPLTPATEPALAPKRPAWAEELSDNEIAFVKEYLLDFNATQSAIRVGYEPNSAHVQGCLMLKRSRVAIAVKSALDTGLNKAIQTTLLNELQRMIAHSPADFWEADTEGKLKMKDPSTWTDEQWMMVKGYKRQDGKVESEELLLYDRAAIIRQIQTALGVFRTVEGASPVNVTINVQREDEVVL